MRRVTDSKIALAALAGISLVGALSSCSTGTPATNAPLADGAAPATSVDYSDGTYTESGNYQSPNGTEQVDVTLTLAANIVTAVTVVGQGESPNSKQYQGQFISGIGAEVVGKDINTLKVDKVAGSSLTSGGFNTAVTAIKADALAK
ncbi:MAG: hypothetical protein ACOH1K_02590 [Rhodoglobus sp.]